MLKALGWTRTGGWMFESQYAAVVRVFDLGCSMAGIFAKMVHAVRNTWRAHKWWLEKDRNDSKICRNLVGPLALPDVLGFALDGRMDRLRKILEKVDGHTMSVTCGGMWTPATCLADVSTQHCFTMHDTVHHLAQNPQQRIDHAERCQIPNH